MTFRLEMHAASHRGNVRPRNEDAWWCDAQVGLAVVADGMGGHPAGADASAVAVRAFTESFRATRIEGCDERRGDTMERGVVAAHRGIRHAVDVEPAREGMGTTLTAAAFCPDGTMFVAHVGDSRAYRLRDGRLEPLTRDHTWVAEAVASGRIPPAAAATHPLAHVLTQAVGVDLVPRPDIEPVDLRRGDVVLLCSDGLTGPVTDDRIEAILQEAVDADRLDRAPERLVQAALDGGGPDNITAVVVSVAEEEEGETSPSDDPGSGVAVRPAG